MREEEEAPRLSTGHALITYSPLGVPRVGDDAHAANEDYSVLSSAAGNSN